MTRATKKYFTAKTQFCIFPAKKGEKLQKNGNFKISNAHNSENMQFFLNLYKRQKLYFFIV